MEREPPGRGRALRISFGVAVGITTAFLTLALLATYPLLFTNWLPSDAWLAVRQDRSPGDQVHRLHSLMLALISWSALSGVALQFHRPERKLAALLMSLSTVVAVALGLALSGPFSVAGMAPFLLLPLVTCALHPSAREAVRLPSLNPPMLALTVFAAAPWITYALDAGEAARLAGPNGDAEHLAYVVTVGLVIPSWALLGTTDKPGWTFPAGAAILGSACVGLQSLIFQDALSGLDPLWASSALAWCVAFGGVAAARSRRDRRGRRAVDPAAADGRARLLHRGGAAADP